MEQRGRMSITERMMSKGAGKEGETITLGFAAVLEVVGDYEEAGEAVKVGKILEEAALVEEQNQGGKRSNRSDLFILLCHGCFGGSLQVRVSFTNPGPKKSALVIGGW